jgi:hypothetical protein
VCACVCAHGAWPRRACSSRESSTCRSASRTEREEAAEGAEAAAAAALTPLGGGGAAAAALRCCACGARHGAAEAQAPGRVRPRQLVRACVRARCASACVCAALRPSLQNTPFSGLSVFCAPMRARARVLARPHARTSQPRRGGDAMRAARAAGACVRAAAAAAVAAAAGGGTGSQQSALLSLLCSARRFFVRVRSPSSHGVASAHSGRRLSQPAAQRHGARALNCPCASQPVFLTQQITFKLNQIRAHFTPACIALEARLDPGIRELARTESSRSEIR